MDFHGISPLIIKEINQALLGLKERIIADDNIDEICAFINNESLQANTWTFLHCYPAAEEEGVILVRVVIEGKRYILEVTLKKLTNKSGPST